MKKNILLLFFFSCIAGLYANAQAQSPERISVLNYIDKGFKEGNYIKDSLGLTSAQATSVSNVIKDYLRTIALLEGQSFTPAQRKQKITDAVAQRDTDLAAILTTTQLNYYKNLLSAMETRMRSRL